MRPRWPAWNRPSTRWRRCARIICRARTSRRGTAMIQLLPSSYHQLRTCSFNYETLVNIYHARHNHKLKEWHVFCDWIRTASLCPRDHHHGRLRKKEYSPWNSFSGSRKSRKIKAIRIRNLADPDPLFFSAADICHPVIHQSGQPAFCRLYRTGHPA